MPMLMRSLVLAALLMFPATLVAQKPGQETTDEPKEKIEGFAFRFKDRPSFRYGEDLKMDVKAKFHFDFRHFEPPITTVPAINGYSLTRARVGVKGEVTKYFEYEVEREMRGTLGEEHPRHPWRDVYVDFQPYDFVRFKAGKFKVPFGMEENTSEDRLDFISRSQVTDFLAPGRERGGMLHGKLFKGEHVTYEAGIFRFDGENSDIRGIPTARRTYAARVSGEPLRYVSFLPKAVQHVYLGVAATTSELIEGQNGLHGRTISDLTYFDHVFVNGSRRRTGLEFAWAEGRFGLKGEYIRVSEQRKGQGIRANDVPDQVSRGWYGTGSWLVLGEMESNGKDPKKNAFTERNGYGAVEVAARLDILTFFSAERVGTPSPSPRAANLALNSDRTWTFGVTWYLNHFVKLQANTQREWLTNSNRLDFQRQSLDGRNAFWTSIFRLQLAM